MGRSALFGEPGGPVMVEQVLKRYDSKTFDVRVRKDGATYVVHVRGFIVRSIRHEGSLREVRVSDAAYRPILDATVGYIDRFEDPR